MSARELVKIVEFDLDYCSRTFSVYPCGAALGPAETRTNALRWSEAIDNAAWTKTRVTVTPNAVAAPDGTMTADKIIADVSAALTHPISQTFSVVSGETYTASVFFRAAEYDRIRLQFSSPGFGVQQNANFDIGDNNATVISGTPSVKISATGDPLWMRAEMSVLATSNATATFTIYPINNSGAISFAGDGVSGLYIWGAQVEAGLQASDYKRTTTAAVSGPYAGAVRKCYNTWQTCKFKSAYNKSSLTYKFITASSSIPVGGNYHPFLVSVDERSGTVNIAGSDPELKAFGSRAIVSARFIDAPYNDRLVDKYQAERISGAAQTDEGGYNPYDRMTFWTKLKARNPNYAGRPMRVKEGYIENGTLTVETTRHYVLSEIDGPDDRGNVTVKAKDVLTLADNDKAVSPKQSTGYLWQDIKADDTSITLLPAGVGADYATSGWGVIGSEIVEFTRSGDVFTIVRGQRGTEAATHSVNDTFQQTYSVRRERIDAVIYDLLVNYAAISASYIDYADWQAECDRWAPSLKLTADICKPEGVNTLISELLILGVSVWWDDVAQKIRLKINRPIDDDPVMSVTDRNNVISIKQIDNDKNRLTRVIVRTVQIDPTKGVSTDNFLRGSEVIDAEAETEMSYNDKKRREIVCRWINHGEEGLIRVIAKRLLLKYNNKPVKYEIVLDHKDDTLSLVDVISLTSRTVADESGKPETQFMQVSDRNATTTGHQFKITAQRFQFDGRYAYFTEDTRPVYNSSSAAQKARGAYWSDGTNLFADGTEPYVFS